MQNSFLEELPAGLVMIASPQLLDMAPGGLDGYDEFCRVVHAPRSGAPARALALNFDWVGEDWADKAWVQYRLPQFGRQIDGGKTRGASTFTIFRPTNLRPIKVFVRAVLTRTEGDGRYRSGHLKQSSPSLTIRKLGISRARFSRRWLARYPRK